MSITGYYVGYTLPIEETRSLTLKADDPEFLEYLATKLNLDANYEIVVLGDPITVLGTEAHVDVKVSFYIDIKRGTGALFLPPI